MARNLCSLPSTFYKTPPPTCLLHASQPKLHIAPSSGNVRVCRRLEVVARGMLTPRKFMRKQKKEMTVFTDVAEESDKKNWWRLMTEIEDTGSAVSVLRGEKAKHQSLPKKLVLGSLIRFKQLKKWNLVSEVLEWLRTENWWDFNEMDFILLITAYGKLGDFNRAEKISNLMQKKGYLPNVVSHTALMEAYGRAGRYKNAEAIFRRMQTSGPKPSAVTYQIIFQIFVEGSKFQEAEDVFEALLDDKNSPLKPDQKMFNTMIHMYKKSGNNEKARKIFSLMRERKVPQSTSTYNCLMSFETSYKEVSRVYDQMQRSGLRPDVVGYALLIKAYGKARREGEALAVFEDMLDAGVRPTRKAYNILLDAFSISGMVEQAKTVFKSMRRDRYSPDLYSYTIMLSAYVNATDMEGAEKFFKRLKVDGFEPNAFSYGTMIKGYAKENNLEKMMEKYEEMLLGGITPNQTILTTIMDAHGKCKDFDSAVIWYGEMEKHGIPADQKAKNVLLSLAKTRDEKEEANQLVGLADTSSNQQSNNATLVSARYEEEDDEGSDDDDEGSDDDDEEDTSTNQQSSNGALDVNNEYFDDDVEDRDYSIATAESLSQRL